MAVGAGLAHLLDRIKMASYYITSSEKPAQDRVCEIQLEQLTKSLPVEGQNRIARSGQAPCINPLTEPTVKEALHLIARTEQQRINERLVHRETRSTLRAIADTFFATGKETNFLTRKEVEQLIGRTGTPTPPQKIVDSLWNAGLLEVQTFIPDSESGAGTISGMRQIVNVTERGKTLLSVDNQPAVLLAI
jgi:hypothetical protein